MKSNSGRILIQPHRNVRRRGAVLIVAMMCALLAAMILGALLRMTLARAQLSKQHERALQAEWLAEAGIERAAAILSKNPEYAGETWQVAAADLPGRFDGAVAIEIKSDPGRQNLQTIVAVADYPIEPQWRVRHTKQIQYRLISQPPAPPGDPE